MSFEDLRTDPDTTPERPDKIFKPGLRSARMPSTTFIIGRVAKRPGNFAAMKSERYLSQYDASILCKLAESLLRLGEVDFNAGEKLLRILSGSIILPEHVRKKDCVSLFSEVTYSSLDPAVTESVVLVCPQDANHELARVSVISPIGLALIGQPSQTIVDVTSPFGSNHHIKIIDIQSLVTADVRPAVAPGPLFH